jgi:cobaltochelatase CobS
MSEVAETSVLDGLSVRELDLVFKAANGGKSYGFDPSRNSATDTKEKRVAYIQGRFSPMQIVTAVNAVKTGTDNGKAVEAKPVLPPVLMPRADVATVAAPVAPVVKPNAGGNAADQLAGALASIMASALDENKVRAIVDAAVAAAITNHTAVHVIRVPNMPEVNVGSQHSRFPSLLKACNARLRDGHRLNIWLAGPAGSGKTSAAGAVAKALSLPFYTNGALILGYQVTGFVDASGKYHTTAFREAWEKGGVYLWDEVDGSAPNAVIELNTALANGHMTFPDQPTPVARHKDCVILAGANTFGRGATGEYSGRSKQDEAFLSRFVPMEWPIDEAFERQLCANVAWVSRVQAVRAKVKNNSIRNHMITPRATFYGEALIAAGFTPDQAAEMVLRQGAPDDVWQKIKA